MSLIHVSPLNPNRVYARRFDHEEAKARHVAGESIAALACEYGVTYNMVWQLVSEKGARWYDHSRFKGAGRCVRCGAATNGRSRYGGGRTGLCLFCVSDDQATSVRPETLRCITCREWKPDEDFPFNRAGQQRRRGRHGQCRVCQTIARRDHRARNREADNAYQREYRRRRREGAGR